MFEKGEYVIYSFNGICKIEDIQHLDISGCDKDKLYYILIPLRDKTTSVYLPVDNEKIVIRKVLSEEMAWKLIDEIPELEELWIENDKQRENAYKEALKSCDCREWIRIIKTSYARKQARMRQGKKITNTDEKYLKQAMDNLHSELAFVLGKEKEEMEALISERMKVICEEKS